MKAFKKSGLAWKIQNKNKSEITIFFCKSKNKTFKNLNI